MLTALQVSGVQKVSANPGLVELQGLPRAISSNNEPNLTFLISFACIACLSFTEFDEFVLLRS
jgi:hypothetical protein